MAHLFANDTIASIPSKSISGDYQRQLRAEHSGSKWGSTGGKYSGADVLSLLRNRAYITSVLDFGAGKASMASFIREFLPREIEWTNYDPGMPKYDVLPDRQFDLVITTDVLEHVEPSKIYDTMLVLQELTGKVLYNDIACYPTGKLFGSGPYEGEDLHLIVEDPSWWRNQFNGLSKLQEFEYRASERLSKGAMKKRCMMIHERV